MNIANEVTFRCVYKEAFAFWELCTGKLTQLKEASDLPNMLHENGVEI